MPLLARRLSHIDMHKNVDSKTCSQNMQKITNENSVEFRGPFLPVLYCGGLSRRPLFCLSNASCVCGVGPGPVRPHSHPFTSHSPRPRTGLMVVVGGRWPRRPMYVDRDGGSREKVWRYRVDHLLVGNGVLLCPVLCPLMTWFNQHLCLFVCRCRRTCR